MAEYVEGGANWLDTPWLTAEFYFYRRIMEAIGYFENNADPFQQAKDLGLTSAEDPIRSLTTQLATVADTFETMSGKDWSATMELFVLTALWGAPTAPLVATRWL
jgi:hypothetical protein